MSRVVATAGFDAAGFDFDAGFDFADFDFDGFDFDGFDFDGFDFDGFRFGFDAGFDFAFADVGFDAGFDFADVGFDVGLDFADDFFAGFVLARFEPAIPTTLPPPARERLATRPLISPIDCVAALEAARRTDGRLTRIPLPRLV